MSRDCVVLVHSSESRPSLGSRAAQPQYRAHGLGGGSTSSSDLAIDRGRHRRGRHRRGRRRGRGRWLDGEATVTNQQARGIQLRGLHRLQHELREMLLGEKGEESVVTCRAALTLFGTVPSMYFFLGRTLAPGPCPTTRCTRAGNQRSWGTSGSGW